MYNLICYSEDMDWVRIEGFETIDEAWEHNDNMGSSWFFYPRRLVVDSDGVIVSVDTDSSPLLVGRLFYEDKIDE